MLKSIIFHCEYGAFFMPKIKRGVTVYGGNIKTIISFPLERGMLMATTNNNEVTFYRVQMRHYVPFESQEVFTDSQIVFNSKSAMDKFTSEFRKTDFKEIAQTEICHFNDRGVLAKTRVLKNYLKHTEEDDE